jgi:peptidyl-prolyl cis-trans isomerase D
MATLENIRKRGPLVAAVIGFALLAFILGDLFNSGGGMFTGDRFRIAEVEGENIDYRDYEAQVQTTIENYKANYGMQSLTEAQRDQIRQMVWDNMVQNILLQNEYEATGVAVSSDELFDLMQGRNVDPMVARDPAFANPQTGQFDPSRVVYFYKNRSQDQSGQTEAYLLNLEERVSENRMIRKYLTLVDKGLYIPTTQVEREFKSRNYLVDFDYVGKMYTEVPDSIVTITEEDLKAYYKEHKDDFEQETSRDIVYVTFDVLPSSKDTANTLDWVQKSKAEFKSTEDDQQFINFNSDESFDPKHYKQGDIANAEIDSFLFAAEPGAIYGPYFEGGAYKLAKLIEVKDLPDSLEAKHILIAINGQSIPDATKAKLVADSLKTVIENGVDFATVAKEYSADQLSMEEGGELGWVTEGQQVNRMPIDFFSELVDKNLNEIVVLEQNYGVHLMVKTGQGERFKKVQVGILERKVVPSTETYKRTYANASKFAGENRKLDKFNEAVTKEGLIKRSAPGLTESGTFIPGLEAPRQLIRWAYNAKIGEVSEVFELGKRYVVGALTDIKEEGIAPLKQVENQVRLAVIKEKKAEVLLKQLNETKSADLTSWAQKLNKVVKEAKNISFTSFQVPGMGFEPTVIANAVTSEKGKISEPIKGESGVYVINVKIITPSMSTEGVDLNIDRNRLLSSLKQRIYPNPQFGGTGEVIRSLVEAADIQDERAKFY